MVTRGAGLPLAGVLVILPTLAATGLLDVADQVYGRAKAALDGLHSLLLTMVLAALVGRPAPRGWPGSTRPTWAG